MSTVLESKARHEKVSAEEYHAHPAIGASMLLDFLKSRRLYEGRYVTETVDAKQETPAMFRGTLVHMRVLEPERYRSLIPEPFPALAPDGKKWLRRKGSDHEKWWNDELAKREGMLHVGEEDLALVETIASALLSKKFARRLLEQDGEPEFSIFWTDPHTGLELKCRVDWFSSVSLDIKTTEDPTPEVFAKRAFNLGYHIKRAHYLAGLSLYRDEDAALVHMAVGTTPPFSAGAYELDDRDRITEQSLGRHQWRRGMNQLAKCLESGDFSDPWESEIIQLELPAFAFTSSQYQI